MSSPRVQNTVSSSSQRLYHSHENRKLPALKLIEKFPPFPRFCIEMLQKTSFPRFFTSKNPKNLEKTMPNCFSFKNNETVPKNFLKLLQNNPETQTRKKMQEMSRFLPWKREEIEENPCSSSENPLAKITSKWASRGSLRVHNPFGFLLPRVDHLGHLGNNTMTSCTVPA